MNLPAMFSFFKKRNCIYDLLIILAVFAALSSVIKNKNDITNGQVEGFRDLLTFLPTSAPYPENKGTYFLAELSAKSAVVIDVDSGIILYQKYPNMRLLPASTTKIMTALIALENYKLDEILEVAGLKIDGNSVGLAAGEQITVENLLKGLLIGSGNDAAQVLAENFAGGMSGFVWAMNQKAVELKLENTHFTNPIGLDEEGHYSTAIDLAKLAVVALKNPTVSEIVSTPELEIADITGTKVHRLKNTNELVGKLDGVKGIKTGWTQNAGECLVALTERNQKRIISVILGSTNRFGETENLISWVFENFDWRTTIAPATYP